MEWNDEQKALMIRQARNELRMKQYDFAEMMGSSNATVCQWEMGRRVPRGPTWSLFLFLMENKGITFDKNGLLVGGRNISVDGKLYPNVDKLPAKVKPVRAKIQRKPGRHYFKPESANG